ncbi:intron-binding protein aquarius [Tanacetum coccineum]
MTRTVRVSDIAERGAEDLHEIFLGYVNPSAAQWTNTPDLLEIVDFKDTFLDADHLRECFSDYQKIDVGVILDSSILYKNVIVGFLIDWWGMLGEHYDVWNHVQSSNPELQMPINKQFALSLGVAFMLAIAGIAVVVALFSLTMTDILASILAFIPTGWGRLLICVTWKPVLKKITEISEKQSDEKRKRLSKTQEEDNVEEAVSVESD